MKRKLLFILFYFFNIFSVCASELSLEQKSISEVANAFYNKKEYIQYSEAKYNLSKNYTPEQASSQNTLFTVCSSFAYLSFYQFLGYELPIGSQRLVAYGLSKSGTDELIFLVRDCDNKISSGKVCSSDLKYPRDSSTSYSLEELVRGNGRDTFIKFLKSHLKVGDLIVGYTTGNNGHVLLVSSEYTDETGNKNFKIINSVSNRENNNYTKLRLSLSYDKNGSIEQLDSIEDFISKFDDDNYFSIFKNYLLIIRPLSSISLPLSNIDSIGTYSKASCNLQSGKSSTDPRNYVCEEEKKEYSLSSSTKMRLKYSGIKITKEVRGIDKKIINGSVVDIGDEFEYVINISNSSLNSYDSFIVNENISDYVNVIDINNNGIQNKSVIRWNINSLKSGDSIQLVYKVKVKNNLNNLNKSIISTGTVGDDKDFIDNAIINNKISTNRNTEKPQKSALENRILNYYNNYYNAATYRNLLFPFQIYNNSYFSSNKLSFYDFLPDYSKDEIDISSSCENLSGNELTSCINKVSSELAESLIDDLIMRLSCDACNSVSLHPNSEICKKCNTNNNKNIWNLLKRMVLNNYYGFISKYYNSTLESDNTVLYKLNEFGHTSYPLLNVSTDFYNDHLSNGDILIYFNYNDVKNVTNIGSNCNGVIKNDNSKCSISLEDGLYVYVYLDGTFYGIHYNKNNNVNEQVSFDVNIDSNIGSSLNKLLGKDSYLILRPSLVESYEIIENLKDINIEYDSKNDISYLTAKLSDFNNLNNNNKLIDISLDNLYSGISITISPKLSNDLVTKAIVKGDVTGFGNADINDASKISDYLLDKNEISDDIYLNAADYDNNGKINIKDIIGVANDWLNR